MGDPKSWGTSPSSGNRTNLIIITLLIFLLVEIIIAKMIRIDLVTWFRYPSFVTPLIEL